jgi:hypothetical protein
MTYKPPTAPAPPASPGLPGAGGGPPPPPPPPPLAGRGNVATEPVFVNNLGSPVIDWAGTITLFVVLARQARQTGGIYSSESIPGLLNRLQIRAQCSI